MRSAPRRAMRFCYRRQRRTLVQFGAMATRTLKWTAWLKLMRQHMLDNEYANLSGYPVQDVAAKLDVSRQRVYQLIEEGTLDVIEIVTGKGIRAATLITEASLDRYLEGRVPDRNRQGYFAFQS